MFKYPQKQKTTDLRPLETLKWITIGLWFDNVLKMRHTLFCLLTFQIKMADKSDLKAELERKKQRLAQIREEKKRKEEEKKKKEVRTVKMTHSFCTILVTESYALWWITE